MPGKVDARAVSVPVCPAAYVRVVGARSASDPHVQDQLQAVLAVASERGWPPPAVYIEIGLPGWRRSGSVLGEVVGYLASGRHDAVIVADLSRLSRDPADVLAFTVHCDRYGVMLEAVEEGRVDEARIAALYARHD
jgi:DNA invertase Pin-like site-specific DNA recombinase